MNEKNLQVTLTGKIALLNEVKLNNIKRKVRTLGITGRSPLVCLPSSSSKSIDILEQAGSITLPSAAKIFKASIFMLSEGQREIAIRINFYALKHGVPAERLVEKSIIKRTTLKKGCLSVNLCEEDIYLDQDFVVAFEYLPNPHGDNQRLSLVPNWVEQTVG